jgi:hypothetical protein
MDNSNYYSFGNRSALPFLAINQRPVDPSPYPNRALFNPFLPFPMQSSYPITFRNLSTLATNPLRVNQYATGRLAASAAPSMPSSSVVKRTHSSITPLTFLQQPAPVLSLSSSFSRAEVETPPVKVVRLQPEPTVTVAPTLQIQVPAEAPSMPPPVATATQNSTSDALQEVQVSSEPIAEAIQPIVVPLPSPIAAPIEEVSDYLKARRVEWYDEYAFGSTQWKLVFDDDVTFGFGDQDQDEYATLPASLVQILHSEIFKSGLLVRMPVTILGKQTSFEQVEELYRRLFPHKKKNYLTIDPAVSKTVRATKVEGSYWFYIAIKRQLSLGLGFTTHVYEMNNSSIIEKLTFRKPKAIEVAVANIVCMQKNLGNMFWDERQATYCHEEIPGKRGVRNVMVTGMHEGGFSITTHKSSQSTCILDTVTFQ